MNNNRANNRRRGRGNNNRQQGGGQQLNRIDSRARGNAPQLLEKYRKLAHDAHLNGDRVTEEYYLQFADHYFRVIADTRTRQEETRLRRDDRWQEGDGDREESDDGSEYADSDYSSYDQAPRDQAPREQTPRDQNPREQAPREQAPRDQAPRRERFERPRSEPVQEDRADDQPREEGERSVYEPAENPFVRDGRSTRQLKPRRDREERRPRREPVAVSEGEDTPDDAVAAFDPAVLPPSIAPAAPAEVEGSADTEAPAKPKRRTRRPRAAASEAGDALESVAS